MVPDFWDGMQGATDAEQRQLNEHALLHALSTLIDMAASAGAEPMQFCLPGTTQPALKKLLDLSLAMVNIEFTEPGTTVCIAFS